jgi:hypothetical protein
LIEYLRSKEDGIVMVEIVKSIKTWRNLDPYIVLRNLSTVKDEDEKQNDDAFSLPLYKYLEDDSDIITEKQVSDYNKHFNVTIF